MEPGSEATSVPGNVRVHNIYCAITPGPKLMLTSSVGKLDYSNAGVNKILYHITAYSSAYFGQGIIPILMANVACSGSESSLVDCSYSRSTSNCGHNEDAGVRCQYS